MTTKKKKIYVAGPMTGFEYFNFPMFDKVTDEFRQKGWQVFNPAEHDRMLLNKTKKWMPSVEDTQGPWKAWNMKECPTLREMLGADLAFITAEADAIVMLPGWERSNGAQAEWATARALGLEIYYS